jgi:hypothetical protein
VCAGSAAQRFNAGTPAIRRPAAGTLDAVAARLGTAQGLVGAQAAPDLRVGAGPALGPTAARPP